MELTADEWFDVYREFHPEATREEFERDWAEFQAWKAEYRRRRSVQ
jgi:hypothetical protein